jgi:tetratricopeptide (TPR) repeat protein
LKSFAILLLLTAAAAAQDPRAQARQKFEDGRLEFSNGRYENALALFQESYQLAPYPALLFNIARCQEQLHHYRLALDAYEHYLAVNPQDTEARARADDMRPLAALEPPPPSPEPSPPPAPPPPTVVVAQTPAQPGPVPVYKKWWLWTAVVGVAAVAVGVGLGVGLSGADPQRTFPPLSGR